MSNTDESLTWRKSTASADQQCVEMASRDGLYLVRDSKNPQGPRLSFSTDEWAAFVTGVKNGEFDPGSPSGISR